MEQTPLPPLMSDQHIRDIETGKFASERMYEMNYRQGMQDMRDIYESDRQRTREVVQALFNSLHAIMEAHAPGTLATDAIYQSAVESLNLAKSINIVPEP